jgi:site-specific recombinase XerD
MARRQEGVRVTSPHILTERHILLMLDQTSASSTPKWASRFRSLLESGFASLMRPSELCALRWDDIHLDSKRVTVRFCVDQRRNVGSNVATAKSGPSP